MSAGIAEEPLPPIVTASVWGHDFEFYGADTSTALDFADGSLFDLVLAPKGKRQPAADEVYTLTSAGGEISFDGHIVSILPAAHPTWAPGWKIVQLRDVTDPANPVALLLAEVPVFRDLADVVAEGGGGPLPASSAEGTQVFVDGDVTRVVRGEAAGVVASAQASAAAAAASAATATGAASTATTAAGTATTQAGIATTKAGEAAASAVAAGGSADAAAGWAGVAATEAGEAADSAADADSAKTTSENILATVLGSSINAGGFLDLAPLEVDDETFTITDAHDGKLLVFKAATRTIVYVDTLAAGFVCGLMKAGAGDVEVHPGLAEAAAPDARLTISTQYAWAALRQIFDDVHVLQGGEDELPDLGINRFLFNQAGSTGLLYSTVI